MHWLTGAKTISSDQQCICLPFLKGQPFKSEVYTSRGHPSTFAVIAMQMYTHPIANVQLVCCIILSCILSSVHSQTGLQAIYHAYDRVMQNWLSLHPFMSTVEPVLYSDKPVILAVSYVYSETCILLLTSVIL